MRIAFLTSSYPRFPGDGIAPFVRSIAQAMAEHGHLVEVVAPYDPDVIPSASGIVKVHRFRYWLVKRQHIMGHSRALEADVRLRPLTFLLLPFFLLSAFICLWRVTGRQKSQVVYVHWVIPNGLVAAIVARFRRIPFIISLHGSDIFLAQKNRWFGAVAGWIFRQAAGVTACSPELRDGALQLGASPSTQLIAWGADPKVFKPAEHRDELRNRLGWGDDFIVMAMGRLVHKKGFDILIRAIPPLLAAHPTIKVIIGGSGPLSNDLEELARSSGIKESVKLLGRIPWDEVPAYLSALDVFVLPSVRDASGNLDGLPTVLLEAMGCGSAVIASDIGGVPLIIQDRVNGLLVQPGSVSDLTRALNLLIDSAMTREDLGRMARKTVVEELNWDTVTRRIETMFLSVAKSESREHRMGSVYREEMLSSLGILDDAYGRVLDVGCHDGLLLSMLKAELRVGVDLNPIRKGDGINLVSADARYLPFKAGCFNTVFALDVIEHIHDDLAFATSISGMVAKDGKVFLTTPSANIRLNPPFLTAWISHKWGHIYRLGYTPGRLTELFEELFDVSVQAWNAPAFRFFYPILRILQVVFPKWVENLVRRISQWDAQRQAGQHGFQIMVASRKD